MAMHCDISESVAIVRAAAGDGARNRVIKIAQLGRFARHPPIRATLLERFGEPNLTGKFCVPLGAAVGPCNDRCVGRATDRALKELKVA
jgi:hypothetical protein